MVQRQPSPLGTSHLKVLCHGSHVLHVWTLAGVYSEARLYEALHLARVWILCRITELPVQNCQEKAPACFADGLHCTPPHLPMLVGMSVTWSASQVCAH